MSKDLIVPEGTNLIINDTQIQTKAIQEGFAFSDAKVKFEIIDAQELSRLFFPGNGAEVTRSFLEPQVAQALLGLDVYAFPASRSIENGQPTSIYTEIPEYFIRRAKNECFKNIWIVDDVVATSLTIRTIKTQVENLIGETDDEEYNPSQRFSYSAVKVPPISWSVFSWLKQASAKIDQIASFAAIIYSRRSGKVPTNSLSTMISNTINGLEIRSSYARKYFTNFADIEALASFLREQLA